MPSLLSCILSINKPYCLKGSKFTSPRWLTHIKRKTAHPSYFQEMERTNTFAKSIRNASEELVYAVESQGSIYYKGDYTTASEAIHHCIDQFHHLLQSLEPENSQTFQHIWSEPLFQLRSRLDALPLPK